MKTIKIKSEHYTIIAEGEFIGKPWPYRQTENCAGGIVLLDERVSLARAQTIYEAAKYHFEKVMLFEGKDAGKAILGA